ncbi:MAG: hypothetical protein ACJ76H_06350 [Bacteriovoracaceae bacterium]|jgi:hypothetical protein
MLNLFRLGVLAVVIFFFNDFYLETITAPKFQEMLIELPNRTFLARILTFFKYQYQYPGDFFSFIGTIIIPAIYYAFIRGVRFHEKGFAFNRGIPFLNHTIKYEDVKRYKLFHPKYVISMHLNNGDSFMIADNSVERVIAILDQHNIPGDLADDYAKLFTNFKRVVLFVLSFTILLFVIRKLGNFTY